MLDAAALRTILGPGSAPLISSGDKYADEAALRHFIELYGASHALLPRRTDRVILDVGLNRWPLPNSYRAKSRAMVVRCARGRAGNYRPAYRTQRDRRDPRYASPIISSARSRRPEAACTPSSLSARKAGTTASIGPRGDGQDESPLQPLVAQAQDEGYPGQMLGQHLVPYQDSLFRILFSQGARCPVARSNMSRTAEWRGDSR